MWPKGWMNQCETWRAGRPRPGHIVLDGSPAPPPSKGHSPRFSAHICYGQMAGWIKMPLRMEVGLRPGDSVRWGPSSPSPKRGQTTNFRPMSIVAKRLGDQDGIWHGGGPRSRPHCARLGSSSPPLPTKKGQSPLISAHVYYSQTAEWIKMSLGTEVRLGPGDIVLDGDPAPPSDRGTAALLFSAHVYVATIAHLSYCWDLVMIFLRIILTNFVQFKL